MKRIFVLLISAGILTSFYAEKSIACSTLFLSDQENSVVGSSYDWKSGHGLIFFNKRNVQKTALNADPSETSAKWVSKYGSITLNQYGRELPAGGMNEKGLVVEMFMLKETVYPPKDSRPIVNEAQWIQYQLDNFSSVEELIANIELVRVKGKFSFLHYFACDLSKTCATIEFLQGKTVIHNELTLPIPVLTNSIYSNDLSTLPNYEGFGGNLPIPQTMNTTDRFVRLADLVRRYDIEQNGSVLEYALKALESVNVINWTKWQRIYDINEKTIYFKIVGQFDLKELTFDQADFDCQNPVQMIDMNGAVTGDTSQNIKAYNYSANLRSVELSFENVNIPHETLEYVAQYPETTICLEQ